MTPKGRPRSGRSPARYAAAAFGALAVAVAGCSAGSVPPATPTEPAPPTAPTDVSTAPAGPPSPAATATADAPPPESIHPRPVVLPGDETPHTDPLEWWYYNIHLTDEDGSPYGLHFVVFQAMAESGLVAYQAHAGLSDLTAGTHEQAGRFSFSGQAPQPAGGFQFAVADWTLEGGPEGHALTSVIDGAAVELTMTPAKPAVLHDEEGYLEGPTGWTYYYSWTRMDVSGTLSRPDRQVRVTGVAWMDHQWGDFAVPGYPSGWQWFAVQLDDGSDLMVTEARDGVSPPTRYGTLVLPDGNAVHLPHGAIVLITDETWTSPHTGAEYPAGWKVAIPDHGIELDLTPSIADAEMTVAFPPQTTYWEGVVEVTATLNGAPVSGRGFVELVGYLQPNSPLPAVGEG